MQLPVKITTYSGLLVASVPALCPYLKRYAYPNLFPRVSQIPTQKGAREERPCFRLVTCLGDKFMFMGGVLIYQTVVAAAVSYLQNRVSVRSWKVSSLTSFGVGRRN